MSINPRGIDPRGIDTTGHKFLGALIPPGFMRWGDDPYRVSS